jgi:hypothetical protein
MTQSTSQIKIRFWLMSCLLLGLHASALFAENPKFDGATGIISIPVLEVAGPFGGLDCYRLQLTLSNPERMDFSLSQAEQITCPTLSTSNVKPSSTTACGNPGTPAFNQCQTQRLQGSWSFIYQVGENTLTYVYSLTVVEESSSTPNEYNIWGKNLAGDLVIGGYNPEYQDFSLLEMTATMNRYFSFTFSGSDSVSGCAYHANTTGSVLGECYPMTGTRTDRSVRRGGEIDMTREDSFYESFMRKLAEVAH